MGALRCGLLAGAVAGALSGAPSTAHALATGRDPLEAVRAAGTLVRRPTLPAGAAVHSALSLAWGAVLVSALPRRHTVLWGVVGGAAVAALDLGVIGRKLPRVRALPLWAQVADHLAFGALAGAVVSGCRSR